MKNKYKFFLPLLIAITLASCNSNNDNLLNTNNVTYGDELTLPERNDYSEYAFPDYSNETHFNNVDQYANMQSYMGWYYCYGSTDENELEYMVYEPFSGKYRSNSELEAYVQKDEWQPSAEHEIMCCFKCPRNGSISVKIDITLIYEQATGDDGISVYCLKSTDASEAFGSAYLIGQNPIQTIEADLNVHKNEVIYVVMSCNESRWNDLTRLSIDVVYK